MNLFDFILFPFYVALFYFLFSARRKNYTDPILRHYHKQGFSTFFLPKGQISAT